MPDNQRIDDLRRRVQKDPASIAFAQLAEELRRAGQLDESIDTCRTGLTRHPGYLSARVTLGRALLELNELEAAQGELEHVLRSAPENLAAIRGLGEIHHRRGDLAEALAQYRAALALARNDPDLEQTVAQLARQVEPPRPAEPPDGLSFDQMESELLKLVSPAPTPLPAAPAAQVAVPPSDPSEGATAAQAALPPPEPVPAATAQVEPPQASTEEQAAPPPPAEVVPFLEPEVAPAAHEPVPSEAELEHAARTLAALEQWLDAIHVARADRRA